MGFNGNQGKLLKNKVSSEKNQTYLNLRAFLGQKKPVAQNYHFISISFYRNIVGKIVSCDMGLKERKKQVSKN